jgi:hypothetical protein
MLMTQSHYLPPAKQFLMNCNDVEGSDPLSTGEVEDSEREQRDRQKEGDTAR